MNIYVLPRGKADEFKSLCESIRLRPNITDKQFKEAGFTNYYEPIFYFCKGLVARKSVSYIRSEPDGFTKVLKFVSLSSRQNIYSHGLLLSNIDLHRQLHFTVLQVYNLL